MKKNTYTDIDSNKQKKEGVVHTYNGILLNLKKN